MSDSVDVQLLLKKRARRRLIGAVAFAGLAAVVLPMVMDAEPKQQVQDVQIRIPGQDQVPPPRLVRPGDVVAPAPSAERPAVNAAVASVEKKAVADKNVEKPVEKTAEKPAERVAEKPVERVERAVDKPIERKPEKTAEKPADKAKPARSQESDAQRAAAILGGKLPDEASKPASSNGQYVVLIGAFSNQANVKQLQTKLGELAIPVFTEPLDTPDGRKTRVRAGPFAGRDAADKALERMKRIGVGGVVAAKQ